MPPSVPESLINSIAASSFVFLVLVWLAVHWADRKFSAMVALTLLGWFGLVIGLGRTGFFAQNPLFAPNIFWSFLILFEILRRLFSSPTIGRVAEKLSNVWLISIQTYRIVGVGFLILYARGILPAAFAFSAGIGDILVGLLAPLVAVLYYFRGPYWRELAIGWNILGIADLIIAVAVGILAFPRPVQFLPTAVSTEPLSLFPLVIIPLFAVPLALVLHLFSLRILKVEKEIH